MLTTALASAPACMQNGAMFYQPARPVSGPAYSPWFKMIATVLSFGLAGYAVSFLLRYPVEGLWPKLLMVSGVLLLLWSWRGFLHATVTIDAEGIRQGGWFGKQAAWSDIRSAKMIGIPYAGWLAPPRLVVRTGTAFYTFNGGTEELLTEFARISLAYEMKR